MYKENSVEFYKNYSSRIVRKKSKIIYFFMVNSSIFNTRKVGKFEKHKFHEIPVIILVYF